MHPISDKELDRLFRQRFDELGVEPADTVWGKISDQLGNQKNDKKSFSLFWMAAAGIIVVLSAGLWLFRPVEVIKLQGVAQVKEENIPAPAISEPLEEVLSKPLNKDGLNEIAAVPEIEASEKKVAEPVTQVKVQEIVKPQIEKDAIVIAANKDKVPVIQESKQKLVISQPDSFDKVADEVVYAKSITKSDLTENIQAEDGLTTSHRKIKSIGSLVNFVIAKVDRREDKIIEFKDGDEGSELAGLNLGLVKYRSRK